MIDFRKFGDKRSLSDILKFEQFILFGAGDASDETLAFLEKNKKKVVAYFDNNRSLHGNKRNGILISDPRDFNRLYSPDMAVIISSSYQCEIAGQLIRELGVPRPNIFPYLTQMFSRHYNPQQLEANSGVIEKAFSLLEDSESREYFERILAFRYTLNPLYLTPNPRLVGFYHYDSPNLAPRTGAVIVDCGAFTGDSAYEYLKRIDNTGTVYAIEASPTNFNRMREFINEKELDRKIVPLNLAVGSKSGEVFLDSDESQGQIDPRTKLYSHRKDHSVSVDLVTLDSLFLAKYKSKIDLIKIDIEGGEKDCILGASSVIREYLPDFAVAAYHRPEDLWAIPLLLNDNSAEYRVFAGHHPKCVFETEYYVTAIRRV